MTRGSAAAMHSFHVCWAAVWMNADCCLGGGGGDFFLFKRFGLCARSASTRGGKRECAFTPRLRTGALKPSQAASSPQPSLHPPPSPTAATVLPDTLTDIYTLVLSVWSPPTDTTAQPAITVAPPPHSHCLRQSILPPPPVQVLVCLVNFSKTGFGETDFSDTFGSVIWFANYRIIAIR